MKKNLIAFIAVLLSVNYLWAQVEPTAGTWKTWLISSGRDYRLPRPADHKSEIAQVLARQQRMDASTLEQINFWNAGGPGYRWQEMMGKIWVADTANSGMLAGMLMGVVAYDAIVAAWDTKYAYKRPRPFAANSKIKLYGVNPQSPSYPCEHSVVAGVAVTVFSKFYPRLADSVKRMAERAMDSRIAAGLAFPSDTRAGFELGKKIAQDAIERTRDFLTTATWDGKIPEGPGYWHGKRPLFPIAGRNKTLVLTNGSQYRPAPPPDFAKDMAELKSFKQTFRSQANAFYYASQTNDDVLTKKLFEYNLHLNPPRTARIFAAYAAGAYDAVIACWDAKFAYWGTRPDQYDTTYRPLIPTPPFPGYPSGHAVISGFKGELFSYFFPAEKAFFQKMAKDAAESRFHGGIHFRTDNEVGLDLGRKIAHAVLEKIKLDGAGNNQQGF
jgi:membrane-associated phospholipid phosphatase